MEFAYPPVGNEARNFPPPLFYPDFTKSTVQRKEELESFPVILTNEKGDRYVVRWSLLKPVRGTL